MPIKHAAFKSMRQAERRRSRNLRVKLNLKRAVKAVRKAAAAKDKAKASDLLKKTVSIIDRAAQKDVIKKNTAARLKSRLHAAVKKLS
ncbi:MAG: 30S ribosomal protein S20 [Candidatus Kerfeldbacteria bacterium]